MRMRIYWLKEDVDKNGKSLSQGSICSIKCFSALILLVFSLSLHRRNSVPDAKFSISGFRYQNLSKEISLSLCCYRCIASQRQKVSKSTIERNRRGWKEWGGTSQRKIVSIMQRNTSQYLILLHFFTECSCSIEMHRVISNRNTLTHQCHQCI